MCTTDRVWAQLSSIESAIYSPIIIAVKVSILLQYITIFVTHRGTTFHYAVHGLIWTNVLYYTINTVLFVTEVSSIVFWRIGDKSRQDEKMLMAESVPLYKSCGNQPCLGTASAGIIWELPLVWWPLSRTSRYYYCHFRWSGAFKCPGRKSLASLQSSVSGCSPVSQASCASSTKSS